MEKDVVGRFDLFDLFPPRARTLWLIFFRLLAPLNNEMKNKNVKESGDEEQDERKKKREKFV